MLLDCSGNDVYTVPTPSSRKRPHDGDKREYGSIALPMLDLGGHDKYSQGQTNNAIW